MATGVVPQRGASMWRFVGSGKGQSQVVQLPTADTTWHEVFVKAYFSLNDTTVSFCFVQPREMIASAAGTHGSSLCQGFSGSDTQVCSMSISTGNGVYVREYLRNGNSLTANTVFDVYVR